MPVNIGITAVQENSTNQKSISKNEKEFILHSIHQNLRIDGRKPTENRPITLHFNRTSTISECVVHMGNTKVMTCIDCELTTPQYTDRPNEGSINIKVDLSSMANIGFIESDTDANTDTMKSYYSQRIHRILERVLRTSGSGAIDTEALCVVSGKVVWKLNITITILDDDGNLIDCSIVSAFAALRFLKLPATEIMNDGKHVEIYSEDDRDPIPLPLHHTPIPFSFALFSLEEELQCIVDPNQREELLSSGIVTFCFNKHKELCCIDFSSGASVNRSTLNQCALLAQKKVMELSTMLEDTLHHADQKLLEERLKRLHDKTFPSQTTTTPNVPFWEEMEGVELEVEDTKEQLKEEQKAYRLQALDFDHLHQAASVKEQEEKPKENVTITQSSSSLLQAMIHSAKQQTPSEEVIPTQVETKVEEDVMQVDTNNYNDDDDDEEEEVTMLQNEFSTEKTAAVVMEEPKKNVNDIIGKLKKTNKKKFKKKNQKK